MNDERDIKLGNIQHLDVDENSAGTTNSGANRLPPKRPGESSAAKPAAGRMSREPEIRAREGSNWWMGATLFLLVVVLVLGVWFARQLSSLQAVVDVRISESSEQLSSLSSQLSATDESASQSWEQVKETLKLHDSEIRKLWDLGNKRNKGLIDKNVADIARLQKSQQDVAKSLDVLKKDIEKAVQQYQTLVIARNQLQTQVDLGAESIKSLETRVANQQKVVQEVEKLLPGLRNLGKLESAQGGLANRLSEVESAITAFDNYRRQTNVRLDRIEGTAK